MDENVHITCEVISQRHQGLVLTTCKADVIVLLCMADNSPSLTEMERVVLQMGAVAQTELVLLHHGSKTCPPGLTSLWLKVW